MFRRLKALRHERSERRKAIHWCHCTYCLQGQLLRQSGGVKLTNSKSLGDQAAIKDSVESNDFSRECRWGDICKWQCQREDVGLSHCDERGPQ